MSRLVIQPDGAIRLTGDLLEALGLRPGELVDVEFDEIAGVGLIRRTASVDDDTWALRPEVDEAIARGLADIAAGRVHRLGPGDVERLLAAS